MYNNQFVGQVLHPFILYALFGTMIGYLLVKSSIKYLGIKDPKRKIKLLFLPVLVPFLNLAIRQLTAKNCLIQLSGANKTLNIISSFICNSGIVLANILLPLFFLAMAIALVKGIVSIIACRKLVSKYGYASLENYPGQMAVLEQISIRAGIKMPKLIITGQRSARSFTFGIKNPVIVLTRGIIEYLDIEETEAVLAHEMAHIVRGDSRLNWVAVFFRDLMFFAPAMYLVFSDIIKEKEKASDDLTMELTDKHWAFGEALIKVWRLSSKTTFGSLAFDNFSSYPNFIKHDGTLEARLVRIIEPEGSRFKTRNFIILAGSIALAALAISYIIC